MIACASKYERKLSWMKAQKMTRTDAESDLEFLGFIIFENKLKPSTAGVISELNEAGIRNVMCTGDNILTAISVARECNMLGRDELCFIPHFIEGLFLPHPSCSRNSVLTIRRTWYFIQDFSHMGMCGQSRPPVGSQNTLGKISFPYIQLLAANAIAAYERRGGRPVNSRKRSHRA